LEHRDTISSLFFKYLENKCSPEETQQLFDYLSAHDNELLFTALITQELANKPDETTKDATVDTAVLKVRNSLLNNIGPQTVTEATMVPNARRLPGYSWLKIVALWLVIASSALYGFYRYFDQHNDQTNTPTKSLTTQSGQRKFIRLFDGTKVWLYPSSKLIYSDQFTVNKRRVELDGEAFFEVAKDKKHPFIITSGRMQTEVVGTSFNVRSYSKLADYSVTVVTGVVKVKLLPMRALMMKEVILKPKQQAIFDKERSTLTSNILPDIEPVLQQRDGIIKYNGTPVPEVVADLQRWYNQPIYLENQAADCLCYGKFDVNKPVLTVIRQLAAAINARVKVNDGKYVIEGGCDER
jgi:ferric-dicitrate binding protein FerR (iron transport regulator)